MAFVQTTEWQIAQRPRAIIYAGANGSRLGTVRLAFRHLLAVSGSVLIHIFLLYFFLSKMLGSGGEADHAGIKSESLLLFDLSDGKAKEPQRSELPKEQASQSSTPAQVSPPAAIEEWKMMSLPKNAMPAVKMTASASSASAASSPQSNSSPAGAVGGGGGNYDPYAGAAPQRLMPQFQQSAMAAVAANRAAPPAPNPDPLQLNQDVLNKLRRIVARNHLDGATLKLTLEINPNGYLNKINLSGGPAAILSSIKQVLNNQPLYRVIAPLTKVEIREISLS